MSMALYMHGSPLMLQTCRMAVDVCPTIPTSRPLPVAWHLEGSGEAGVDTFPKLRHKVVMSAEAENAMSALVLGFRVSG